jgi:hypothetical protein
MPVVFCEAQHNSTKSCSYRKVEPREIVACCVRLCLANIPIIRDTPTLTPETKTKPANLR